MKNKIKVALVFLAFFLSAFLFFSAEVIAQTCSGSVTWTCTNYGCKDTNPFWWEDPIYKCYVNESVKIKSQCYSSVFTPGKCVYGKQTLANYCIDTSSSAYCIRANCDPNFTGGDGAPGSELTCPSGGGTGTTTTPTPTPATVCKPLGDPCSGGGGNCCSKVCSGGVCGGVTPTPTTPPSGGGGKCDTCKRGGESCSGSGKLCCSGTCKKDGTCAGGGGCGPAGGGGAPPPPPPPPPPPATATPIPTATPTPIPLPWFKLRDASLVGNISINSPIPASPLTPYDVDDPGNRYLLDNSTGNIPGVATGQNISIGGAVVSSKGWKATGKSYSPQLTVSKFIDYVRSKKKDMVVEITQFNQAQQNKINILSGNVTLTEGELASKRPLVLIVVGDVMLSGATVNPSNQQQIIMSTGEIAFNTSVSQANGLYIADGIDFGITANQGIKIIGNLIAQSSFSNARQWSNGKRPGLFIVFDPSHYLGLLNMFSTITYDWRQIQ